MLWNWLRRNGSASAPSSWNSLRGIGSAFALAIVATLTLLTLTLVGLGMLVLIKWLVN